jgi:hypothetical protein
VRGWRGSELLPVFRVPLRESILCLFHMLRLSLLVRYPVRVLNSQFSGSPSYNSEETRTLGCTRLSAMERWCRINEQRCLSCGQSGRFRASCPELTEI